MQFFRRVMIVGGYRRGKLHYSGYDVRHPDAKGLLLDGPKVITLRVIFWFWVPPEKRDRCRNPSEVPDIRDFERKAMAEGEIEEVRLNQILRDDITREEATRFLLQQWETMCRDRLGFIPETNGISAEAKAPVIVGEEAQAREYRRRAV